MPNDNAQRSPIESSGASIALDKESGEVILDRQAGQQPVTIAGGALGPIVSDHGAETNEGAP